jgi:phosphoribosylanthranilate isomerase
MGLFVKICGLTSYEQAAAVAELEPDALGFVFWSRSRRFVSPETVADWSPRLPASVLKVGVMVDPDPAEARAVRDQAGLDVVQWHGGSGGEGKDWAGFEGGLWKSIHLDRERPLGPAPYRVDAYLVDSYSAESPGGTGRVCDWEAARAFVEASAVPVILAGGLDPDNVAEAAARVRPWGVDVSSGVEAAPGRKDLERVKEFIQTCRAL